MEDKFVGGKEASRVLGVHQRTLYQWETKKLIDTVRTPGGKRMYNINRYLRENGKQLDKSKIDDLDELDTLVGSEDGKLNLSYVRVSSMGQKDDLDRQKTIVLETYPDHKMIEDIGSGIDLNKKGIRKIIKLAIAGKINELVVAYKDRLTRFGYELIEDLIKEYSGGKIIVMNTKDDAEPEEELAHDVLQIMNVFTTKMNSLRKYKKKEKDTSTAKKDVSTMKKDTSTTKKDTSTAKKNISAPKKTTAKKDTSTKKKTTTPKNTNTKKKTPTKKNTSTKKTMAAKKNTTIVKKNAIAKKVTTTKSATQS